MVWFLGLGNHVLFHALPVGSWFRVCSSWDSADCILWWGELIDIILHWFPEWVFFQFPALKRFKPIMTFLLCMSCFLISLPCMSYSGMNTTKHFYLFLHSALFVGAFVFQIMDEYGGGMSVMWIAIFEVIGIMWFYGANNFAKVIYEPLFCNFFSIILFQDLNFMLNISMDGCWAWFRYLILSSSGQSLTPLFADITSWSSSGRSFQSCWL